MPPSQVRPGSITERVVLLEERVCDVIDGQRVIQGQLKELLELRSQRQAYANLGKQIYDIAKLIAIAIISAVATTYAGRHS
jgi:hypothetical protein